jgi:hypothetical protein
MSKYKKVTYCDQCGCSNPWALSKGSSLMESPNFCSSCGKPLKEQDPKKEGDKVEVEATIDQEEDSFVVSDNIPPLELDIEACVFGAKNSQPLSNLLKPVPQEKPENGG